MTEHFDLPSLKNRLLGKSPSESLEGPPVASVAIIINPEDRGSSVLLIRRTERSNDPWSGQIGFPGGHKSPEDQSLIQTAIRETEEEVGIRLIQHELLGSLPFVTTRSRRVQVAPFVFALKSAVTVKMNREVAEGFWLPLTELHRLEVKRRQVHAGEGTLEADSYDFEGRVIWGLTFRILNLLLDRRLADDL
jgi:8-oxo-dGTP pyrophosphatase MutT (NUDIX family)